MNNILDLAEKTEKGTKFNQLTNQITNNIDWIINNFEKMSNIINEIENNPNYSEEDKRALKMKFNENLDKIDSERVKFNRYTF